MIQRFKLDYNLSKKIYEDCKDLIQEKECYHNVADIFVKYIVKKPDLYDFKVVFGAWQIPNIGNDNVFARHCFFMLEDRVVDPMYFLMEETNIDYLAFKGFSVKSYYKKLVECQGDALLGKYSQQIYFKAFNYLTEHKMLLLG